MENKKRALTKKKLLDKSGPLPDTAQKEKNKQSDQNKFYLSESGATTASSLSSNTKHKETNGNNKTPKKNNFQKSSLPNPKKQLNKIYSKGIIKNNGINTALNSNNKSYNRTVSLINIDNNKNSINKNDLNILLDKSITNRNKKNI